MNSVGNFDRVPREHPMFWEALLILLLLLLLLHFSRTNQHLAPIHCDPLRDGSVIFLKSLSDLQVGDQVGSH